MPHVTVNGLSYFFREAGTGPQTVLLLHAFPLHSGMWEPQILALQASCRVVALDYPGMGRSAEPRVGMTLESLADDVVAFLSARGVEQAAVVGLSMGGYLAMALLRRAPRVVTRLVLADTRETADPPEGVANRERFAQRVLEEGAGWVADEMVPKLLTADRRPSVEKRVRELVARATPAGMAACQRAMAARPDSGDVLRSATCPVLVVVGQEDALTPPADARRMFSLLKGARLAEIPEAAHLANLENVTEFNRVLVDFLGPSHG
jgi:pimeloyl-ACP methyl ester carboxylesterase